MGKKPHNCANAYRGEGARGGCYFDISATDHEGYAQMDVGWSCVTVHHTAIPVTWLAEVIAIATAHKGGIAGFLAANTDACGGESYALMCDPALVKE